MKKLLIAAGGLVIVIVAGFFLYRHFVINSIMDGPFMENITPEVRATEPEQKPGTPSAREPASGADPESASAQESALASAQVPEQASERALPETAHLVEFSWHQSAMNHDDCFDFWMKTTEENPEQPYLYCSYTDPETRERIELGDEMFIYRAERCPIIPYERWQELGDFLREPELTPYQDPTPELLDATDSKLELTWSADGQQITEVFDGRSADGLLELLRDITKGVIS